MEVSVWKTVQRCALFVIAFSELVSCQKCPFGWYGYTAAANSKCYKFVYTTKLTWEDSRDYCRTLQGDLLKLESQREWNWVVNQLRGITSRKHLRNPLFWAGLNNREYLTTWEWADGSAATKYITWRPGEPNNYRNRERCAEIKNSNQFNDDSCSNKYYFICNRPRGLPLLCDTDRAWQPINGQCYKLYARPNNWLQAKRQCSHDGGALVTIDSKQLETPMNELAVGAKKPLWIGLHSLKTSATTNTWVWTNGTQLTTGFWHGTPHVARAQLNTTCAYISNTLPAGQDWNAGSCGTSRGYICQKPEGVCFPGWIGHGSNCYQFNPQFRLNFGAAARFCTQQNAELLRLDSSTDEMFLQSYLKEMKDSGATSIWTGLSDNNNNTGPFKWRNGRPLGAYKYWVRANPANTRGRQDCVYILTTDVNGKWRPTTSCQSARGVVCRIAMNRQIKPIPRTPAPHYGCPANWRLYQTTCYKLGTTPTNQVTARSLCQKQPGADLAVIGSAGAQGFINRLVRRGILYYIGLNDKAKNGVYVWNDNSAPATYTNWRRGEPNEHNGDENCVVLINGQWNDTPCNGRGQYICSLSAKSIVNPITPSPTPSVDWTVKCGQGWESNPVTDYCYMFSDQQLSWNDAILQCRLGGGNLVSIVSLEEQNYIAGRLSGMSSVAVWTGANDRQTEGGWKWASGDGFAYLNWAPGSPGGRSGQGSDCVAMLTSTSKWDDVACNNRNGYICKKMGNVPTTTTRTPTTAALPAGKKIGCRYGWRSFSTFCYAFIKRTSSWDQANTFCRSIGANLASINSRNEQNWAQGVMPRSSSGAVWIGLSDKQIENRFEWSDGTVGVAYTNWNRNEPNNYRNRNEDCVSMSLQSGKWNDEVCTSPKPGFVCKRSQGIVSVVQSPPPYIIGCPPGAYGYGSYCYRTTRGDSRSWSSASSKCKAINGTLATVNDRFTQSFLASSLVRVTGNFWIGLSDTATPGTYSWVSGHNLLYTAWGKNHTGNEQSTCVAMSAQQPTGLWVNQGCNNRNNYICQLPRRGYTPPPTPGTPFPDVACPQGWTQNYAFCIRLFSDQSVQKSWMDSSAYCQALGGDLASFHTKGNDTAALTMIKSLNQGVWIGLNDRDTEGGHKWSDGGPVDYTNWNQDEPNNYAGAEDCVEMMPEGGWNDLNCYFLLPFICALPRGTVPSTTLAPPVAVNSAKCGSNPSGASWFYYNNNCYLISPTSGDSSSLTYYDAQAYCQNISATLVSVHTEQEGGLLLGKIQSFSQSTFWIGFNKLDNRAYKWTDGSPVDYVSWAQNQPDDYQGSERCALIQKWTGLWNDDLCSQQKGFICKKPLNGSPHIVPPSPNTPGGCPVGFLRANGGRNKCFYQPQGVRKTWSDAYSYCRKLGNNVDIASVEDAFETEFLITYVGRNKGNLWIGLNDHRGSNNFYWQDGSPVAYTNWDGNQPTSAKRIPGKKDTTDCVVVRMYKGHEGRWADVPCNLTFPFICQVKQDPNRPKRPSPVLGACRQGYQFYNGGCYSAKSTAKYWTDAASDCKQDGGNLASINDVYESSFVGTLTSVTSPYWIGMSDLQSPGLYYWNDGSRVVYARWGRNEPSYGQKNGNGCILVDAQASWNDTYCNAKHYYVCKISKATPAPTQSQRAGSCANSQASSYGGSCYLANVNNGRSWPEASFMCQQSGMQLASIYSKDEMNFVLNLVKQAKVTNSQFTPNVWLGLSKSAQGSFAWSDGSPAEYFNWSPAQPAAIGVHGELQECVTFDRQQGTWATSSCYTNMAFICKAAKQYPSTSPATTLGLMIGTNGAVQIQSANPLKQTGNANNASSSGVSGGTIAGTVLGSIFGVLIIAFLGAFLVRSGKIPLPLSRGGVPQSKLEEDKTQENGVENKEENGFDNALYFKNDESES